MTKRLTIVTLCLACLISCRHTHHEPSAQHEQHTEYAAMSIYLQQPDRALSLIDSAVIDNHLDADKADYLRAVVSFYGRNDAAEAKHLCHKVIQSKNIEHNTHLQQQVYSLLASIAHTQENDAEILEYAPKALCLAQQLGSEEEVGRLTGFIILAMAHNGQAEQAAEQFKQILASLDKKHTLGSVIAYLSVTKSMIHILRENDKNDEIIAAINDALHLLSHFQQHHKQYTAVPPDFSVDEFVDFESGELFTHLSIANANLGKIREARHYESMATTSLWSRNKPEFEFTILPLYITLHYWRHAEQIFNAVDDMHLSDTLNHQYVRFLHLRALATHLQGRYAEAEMYTTRAFTLRMRMNEYRMQQQIAEQNALYNLRNESWTRERAEARTQAVVIILLLVIFIALSTGILSAYLIVTRHNLKQKNLSLVKMIDELNSGKRRSLTKVSKDTREEYQRLLTVVFEEQLYACQQLSRETFAEHMHMSRHELNDILSANTDGLSFPQWLNNIRLERACALLQDEPDKTISDIAAAVGLTPDNLRRIFRQQYGISPSEYRQEENNTLVNKQPLIWDNAK